MCHVGTKESVTVVNCGKSRHTVCPLLLFLCLKVLRLRCLMERTRQK